MKKPYICWLFLGLTLAALGQNNKQQIVKGEVIDREERQRQEIGDLYKRVADSRVVVVGTVSKYDAVAKRGAPPSIDSNIAGNLYAVNIEDTLCRQENFPTVSPNLSLIPKQIEIFVPYEPVARGQEHLEMGQRYLLFLIEPDQKKQKTWTRAFDLNPDHTYFRAEEMARGVVLLPQPTADNPKPSQPPVLEKVTRLCRALQEPELGEKLRALNQLAASNDAILRREAQEAMIALQTKQ